MTKPVRDKLTELVAPTVQALGCEFVGCEVIQRGGRSLVRVYIDKEGGVTLDDCERVSRQISAVFEVEDPISSAYDLEVSSPGINRPLFTLEQYQRFIGKPLRVKLRAPLNGQRNYRGILQAADEEGITVVGEGKTWVLPLIDIEKANLAEY